MSRKLTLCLASLALALLAAQPLLAGALYIPIESQSSEDQTLIWISNNGTMPATVSIVYIPEFADGTVREEDPVEMTVNPGRTVLVRDAAPLGAQGLVEISSGSILSVTARLGRFDLASPSITGATLPVIGSRLAVLAGGTVTLQGLQRETGGDVVTDFRFMNLGQLPASCTVTLQYANGDLLGGTFTFPDVAPLSISQFDDALGILGVQELSNVQAAVSCTQTFYAYTVTRRISTDETTVTLRASSTNSALRPPGEGFCTGGAYCFEHAGIFHTPTQSDRVKRLEFPVDPGVYSRIHLRMEVRLGDWASNSNGLHNIFWLALDRNKNLYGYVNFRGPGTNDVLFRHGIGQPQGQKAKITAGAIFNPGETYIVEYLYDTDIDLIELTISRLDGSLVVRITHAPDVNQINVPPGEIFLMDFGFTGQNSNEPPTYGWDYGNLSMEID